MKFSRSLQLVLCSLFLFFIAGLLFAIKSSSAQGLMHPPITCGNTKYECDRCPSQGSSVPNGGFFDRKTGARAGCADNQYCGDFTSPGGYPCATLTQTSCTCTTNLKLGGGFTCAGTVNGKVVNDKITRGCGSDLICNSSAGASRQTVNGTPVWPCSVGYYYVISAHTCYATNDKSQQGKYTISSSDTYPSLSTCQNANKVKPPSPTPVPKCPSGAPSGSMCLLNTTNSDGTGNTNKCVAAGKVIGKACPNNTAFFCCEPKTAPKPTNTPVPQDNGSGNGSQDNGSGSGSNGSGSGSSSGSSCSYYTQKDKCSTAPLGGTSAGKITGHTYLIKKCGANNFSCIADCTKSPNTAHCPGAKTSPPPSGATGTTAINVVLGLPGIGYSGGIPNHTTRPVTIELYGKDVKNPGGAGTTPITTGTGTVTYDNGSDNNAGYFVSDTPIAFSNVTSGQYQILIKVPQYLYKLAVNTASTDTTTQNVFTINANATTSISPLILASGDVAVTNGQVNHLNITDYNVLLSCYKGNSACPVKTAGPNGTNLADLNDDGTVDIVDLNIFLRSLALLQTNQALGCDQGDCQGD